jgi:hypothetical protein
MYSTVIFLFLLFSPTNVAFNCFHFDDLTREYRTPLIRFQKNEKSIKIWIQIINDWLSVLCCQQSAAVGSVL